MDLVADATEEGLVDERAGLQVGAEHDHRLEGRANRHARARQRQVIDAPLQRDDQAIQKGPGRRVLPAEVIEQEDATVRLQMDGRLVITHQRIEGGRELGRGQLATSLDEGPFDEHPPGVEIHGQLPLDALVVQRIVDPHHLALDVDGVGDVDRFTQQLGAGLGDRRLAVPRGAIEEERGTGVDRWAERTLGPVYDIWAFAAWSAEEQRRPVQDEGEGGGAVRTPRHADDELLAVRGDVVVRSRVGVRARLEQRLRRPGLE